MSEPAIIADCGNQVRALWGAEQLQRYRFFDPGAHHAPFRCLAAIHVREIESFPAAVAGGEHGVIGIERIDLDVEQPMNRCVGNVRGKRSVKRSAAPKHRLPGLAAIGAPENVVVAAAAVPAIKRARDQHLGIVGVHRDSNVAKSFFAGLRFFGSNIAPFAASGIEPPHRSICHSPGPRHCSIRNIKISIRSQHSPVRAIFRWLAGDSTPAFARVTATKQVLPAHQRNARIDRRAGFAFVPAGGIENHKHNSDPAMLHGFPRIPAWSSIGRLCDIGKTLHPFPSDTRVGALPQAIMPGTKIQNVAVIGIDRQPLPIAPPALIPPKFERHIGALKSFSAIIGTQDRSIRCAWISVCAARQINPIGIARVNRDALHSH